MLQLFILQLIAHLLADFSLQPQKWCDEKDKEVITRHHIYHITIVLVTSYALSFDPGFWIAAVVLTLLHFLIDLLKSWINLTFKLNFTFFIDQILHLLSII
ncbi:MAG TPA: DUF3307 domain-containing protein, partial [Mariniphaga sp.]|nr:DUF3307 domain-containing protein [Mariniphaga sp.]